MLHNNHYSIWVGDDTFLLSVLNMWISPQFWHQFLYSMYAARKFENKFSSK